MMTMMKYVEEIVVARTRNMNVYVELVDIDDIGLPEDDDEDDDVADIYSDIAGVVNDFGDSTYGVSVLSEDDLS